jgi:hypothetical protein
VAERDADTNAGQRSLAGREVAWAADVDARAKAYWTPERTHGLFGDKQLLFPPAEYGPLLRAMSLIKRDASMQPESVRKYTQICHMVAVIEPQLRDLAAAFPVVRVLDLACGNSYLTLTMASSMMSRVRHPAQILGVDRNSRIIAACRERARRLALEPMLRFEAAMIDAVDIDAAWQRSFGEVPPAPRVHLLVALHACDTATDDAIALGLSLGVPAMAIVPCCQAELARRWSEMAASHDSGPLAPIWNWPHLRREVGATMTDALRSLLLRGCGYDTTPIEFVPSNHTPKNTMIRASARLQASSDAFRDYPALRTSLGSVRLRLEEILPEPHRTNLRLCEG